VRTLSIKARIILATTVVLAILFAGFGIVIYQGAKRAYIGRLDARLQGYAETFREEIEEQRNEKRFPTIKDFTDLKSKGMVASFVRLSDERGGVIFTDSLLAMDAPKPTESVGQDQFNFENVAVGGHRFRSLWSRIETEGPDRYSLQILLPLTEVEASLELLQLLFLIGVPIALIISAYAVYTIVVTSFKPFSTMVQSAEKISASNLRERIPLPRQNDEVFILASALNTMMERIELAFRSQKQFVADASHEIRTPLAIIRSELEYAQKQAAGMTSDESLKIALDEVDRLKKLSDDLLLLARLDSTSLGLKIQSVRVDELLADCVKRMKAVAETKRITLSLTIHGAVEIEADEDKLRTAILNLLDNAIKYSGEAGNVEIESRSVKSGIEVSVRDHGEGIPESEIAAVFERFHRTSSSRTRQDGSGLGLAIVRRILDLHNGTVAVRSTPGEGTTFSITLPFSWR